MGMSASDKDLLWQCF